jgi:lipid-A-disaccharide synthase
MRRLVDHVLCKLPFEPEWYRQRGCNATFVGHPYFDQLTHEELDQRFLDRLAASAGPLVTILPGSRTQEVINNLKWFLKAARLVHQQVPAARFAIASFKESHAELARRQSASCAFPVEVFVGRTPELIQASRCTMACSGSVSLELLYHERPTVVLYWVKRSFYYFAKICAPLIQLKAKYITLVNMLADEPLTKRPRAYSADEQVAKDIPFPEFVTYGDKSSEIARFVTRWLTDETEWHRRRDQLHQLRGEIAHGGASDRAAKYILGKLGVSPPNIPAPHFLAVRDHVTSHQSAVVSDAGDG